MVYTATKEAMAGSYLKQTKLHNVLIFFGKQMNELICFGRFLRGLRLEQNHSKLC